VTLAAKRLRLLTACRQWVIDLSFRAGRQALLEQRL
jgi:hypothetical protein